MSIILNKYYLGSQIKEDEMGNECNRYGLDAKVYKILLRNSKQTDNFGAADMDGRIILK
jgi:hypothetical protein